MQQMITATKAPTVDRSTAHGQIAEEAIEHLELDLDF